VSEDWDDTANPPLNASLQTTGGQDPSTSTPPPSTEDPKLKQLVTKQPLTGPHETIMVLLRSVLVFVASILRDSHSVFRTPDAAATPTVVYFHTVHFHLLYHTDIVYRVHDSRLQAHDNLQPTFKNVL
jgi:hypothetical protein